jgi:parvulin-like peptidyl-prolyl isomerase
MMRYSKPDHGARLALRAGLLLICLAACTPGTSGDEWVATVNGRPISLEALQETLGPAVGEASAEEREEIMLRELERLIREEVVLTRAEELEVEVTDEEIDAFLVRLFGENRESVDPSFREEIGREMLMDRTAVLELASELEVPDSAVAFHFAEHRDRYAAPPQVQVRHIVVEDEEKARWVLAQLQSGADFEELARTHSLGPEARHGGLLPAFTRGELPEAFDRAFDLRPGQVSDVIESPYGYHVFLLEKPISQYEPNLEEVGEKIRGELRESRFTSLRDNWLRELRRKARIRINEAALESLR